MRVERPSPGALSLPAARPQVTTSSAKIRVLPRGEEAWVVQFRELSDRSQAEQLLNWTLHIPAGERERLRSPDEFWVQDLAGCRVFVREVRVPRGLPLALELGARIVWRGSSRHAAHGCASFGAVFSVGCRAARTWGAWWT